jgi:hypothetical protein
MRALAVSAVAVFCFAAMPAMAHDQMEAVSIQDDASLNQAMLQYRSPSSLPQFAWYNPYMSVGDGTYVAPVGMEEGAASGEPADRASSDRAEDEAHRQFLQHVWSDP